ncbi:MAG: hypothetical protein HZB92_09250 [Euryarchaeota archaeon]|nr:hypothetical protein [Euryarchaeota archaeon]
MSVKVRSGHIKFDKKVKYKDLAPVFKDMYLRFLDKSSQMPEDEEVTYMLIRENLIDLENNRKPEGFNRQGKTRMIFPIKTKGGIELYIYRYQHSTKSTDVAKVTESLSAFLTQKKLKHTVDWDDMEMHRGKK